MMQRREIFYIFASISLILYKYCWSFKNRIKKRRKMKRKIKYTHQVPRFKNKWKKKRQPQQQNDQRKNAVQCEKTSLTADVFACF